jgi:6-phosphogluconolactonase
VQFLFGDERCVPPDHPDSNFRMAAQALFTSIGIPPVQIHRMHGEERDPAAAAREYEAQLRTLAHCTPPTIPQLDIVLLGLGNDGHTASLFPETEALRDRHHLVAVGRAPNGVARRLTLTLAVINRANVVLFLVAGAGKAEMVRRILKGNTQADRHLPAALVKPEQGRLIWLLDESAAAHVAGSQSQP